MATSDLERLFDDWALAWSSNDSSNEPERVLFLFVDDCFLKTLPSVCLPGVKRDFVAL